MLWTELSTDVLREKLVSLKKRKAALEEQLERRAGTSGYVTQAVHPGKVGVQDRLSEALTERIEALADTISEIRAVLQSRGEKG